MGFKVFDEMDKELAKNKEHIKSILKEHSDFVKLHDILKGIMQNKMEALGVLSYTIEIEDSDENIEVMMHNKNFYMSFIAGRDIYMVCKKDNEAVEVLEYNNDVYKNTHRFYTDSRNVTRQADNEVITISKKDIGFEVRSYLQVVNDYYKRESEEQEIDMLSIASNSFIAYRSY